MEFGLEQCSEESIRSLGHWDLRRGLEGATGESVHSLILGPDFSASKVDLSRLDYD